MMPSVYHTIVRGPSLQFESEGKTYTMVRPWTNEDILRMAEGSVVLPIREILGPKQWLAWKGTGRKRHELERLTKDSFVAMGVDGDKMYELLGILASDKHCRALEADLSLRGTSLKDADIFRVCMIYEFLNEDTALGRVIHDWKPTDWNRVEYMLADVVDFLNTIQMFGHINAQLAGMKKKFKPPKPLYLRPNEKEEKVVFDSPLKLKAMLGR